MNKIKKKYTVSIKYFKEKFLGMEEQDPVIISCEGKLYSILGHKTTMDLGTKKRRFVIVAGKSFKDEFEQFDEMPEPEYYSVE